MKETAWKYALEKKYISTLKCEKLFAGSPIRDSLLFPNGIWILGHEIQSLQTNEMHAYDISIISGVNSQSRFVLFLGLHATFEYRVPWCLVSCIQMLVYV